MYVSLVVRSKMSVIFPMPLQVGYGLVLTVCVLCHLKGAVEHENVLKLPAHCVYNFCYIINTKVSCKIHICVLPEPAAATSTFPFQFIYSD